MKNFIQRVNHYFLERYPLLWNTRLYWMLFSCALVHGCFYLFGYHTFRNAALFKQYNAPELFIENGALLFSIVISVLILVVWLLVLFRNNAFKNFYPTRKRQLFGSFFIYFLVFVVATTFYISYIAGYKQFVGQHYPASWLKTKREQANLAAAFLPFSLDAYTINNKRYPAPFDTLYCETNERNINFSKPYLTRDNDEYQFYSVEKKVIRQVDATAADEKEINRAPLTDSLLTVYYKEAVVDVSGLVNTEPSFYNYSRLNFGGDGIGYPDEETPVYQEGDRRKAMNKKVHDLLQRNHPGEIKKLLENFLEFAREFKISTNLTAEKWLKLMYHPTDFKVTYFISNSSVEALSPNPQGAEMDVAAVADATPVGNGRDNDPYYLKHKMNYCFDAYDLNRLFTGMENVLDFSVFDVIIYVAIWVAFALACLLFAFRITNLRLLLFSGITAAVIGILIALLVLVLGLANGRQGEKTIAYLVFAVGTMILLGSVSVFRFRRKSIQGILINISLVGIVPYFLLILLIISLHQRDYPPGGGYEAHPTILEVLGVYWNYVLLALGFLFMMLYTAVIRRWRALPER
ncbi:hypothetical protein LL912_16765 [Niabella sp. CC-SYL272]|uniref:hypothetical protein n=1 Tax=Niabella agricola TaxID=2891571 RepID=UPI001F1E5ADF|nr:hypothetical protein [Niabella agricola]MCF3110440.1 hypothetical protein [Niabella agricola]